MHSTPDFLSEGDRALLDREFGIADPLLIEGRLDRIPPDAPLPKISYSYDVTPPGGMKAGHSPHVPCGFSHGAKHWKGWVVEWPDGTRALVGQNCAAEHFGLDFRRVENSFTQEIDRRDALRRLVQNRKCFPAVVAELKALDECPAVTAFHLYWRNLLQMFGETSQTLARLQLQEGRLRMMKKTRDQSAEEELAKQDNSELFAKTEKTDPHLRRLAVNRWKKFVEERPPVWREEEVDLGSCDGYSLIRDRRNLDGLLTEIVSIAEERKQVIFARTSGEWSLRDLASNERVMKEMLTKLEIVFDHLGALRRFTQPSNIQKIVLWLNLIAEHEQNISRPVRCEGGTVINEETGFRLEPPTSLDPPDMTSVKALRKILLMERPSKV